MFAQAFAPEPAIPIPERQRLQSKAYILTRVMTPIATLTVAVAVLFRSPSDFRMAVCIIVSVAAATLVVPGLFPHKFVWTLRSVGVLGVFRPFHRTQFSDLVISVLDMATLALLAVSPIILGKSISPLVLKHATRKML